MTAALWVVSTGIAAVLWTIVGFPLVLAARANRARTRSAIKPQLGALPRVTAVIPVHNGERFVADKIQSVLESNYPPELLDVILLSDGSTDDTDVVASALAASSRVRFVALPKGGKAVALTAAFELLDCDVVLMTDVRQTLEPQCVRRLVEQFADSAVGVVSGTLKIRSGDTSGESSTGVYWKYESWIRENLSEIDSVLGATGPIYAIRRFLVRPLPAGCILDDVWLPMQAVLDGYRAKLARDAVAWDYPTSLTSEFGRKVRTQAGLYQLFQLDTRLLSPNKNRLFWSFVNLKLLRLMLAHMLIAILVASFFLPSPARDVLLGLQGAFYAMAVIDRFVSDGNVFKKVTAPLAAFVTLVWAAFCAQSIFFRDPASLWKTTQVRRLAAVEGVK